MIDYLLLVLAVWLMLETQNAIPSPLYLIHKRLKKPHLQKIMEKEGATLRDVPGSFLPKELEKEVERQKQIRRLKQATEIDYGRCKKRYVK